MSVGVCARARAHAPKLNFRPRPHPSQCRQQRDSRAAGPARREACAPHPLNGETVRRRRRFKTVGFLGHTNLVAQNNRRLFFQSSRGHSLQSRCGQDDASSEGSGGSFLPVPASGGSWHCSVCLQGAASLQSLPISTWPSECVCLCPFL